jgi:adenine-specific DNA methylase
LSPDSDYGNGAGRNDGGRSQLIGASSKTLGWQPTCKCTVFSPTGINNLALPKPVPCTVLDPFAGSGTTGQVAIELGRKAILIELNPKYIDLIKERCNVTPGLPLA